MSLKLRGGLDKWVQGISEPISRRLDGGQGRHEETVSEEVRKEQIEVEGDR